MEVGSRKTSGELEFEWTPERSERLSEEAYCRLQGRQVQSLDREVVEVLLRKRKGSTHGRIRRDREQGQQERMGSGKRALEKRQVT